LAWVLATAVVAIAADSARAEVLVLDACVKQCDAADFRAIGHVRHVLETELKRHGLVASAPDVIAYLKGNVPLSSVADPDLTAAILTEHLKAGIARWAGGQHKEAAQRLGTALAEAAENPSTVLSDPTLRQLIPRAHVGRAVSLMRLGHLNDAKAAIAELVRATSATSILDSWGTEADKIFQLSRKELAVRGTGSLTIQVDDPTAIFYLDESGQPHRTMFAADLLPGIYRVFVQDTTGRSRRYTVEVTPHVHATLDIDWNRDASFEARTSTRRDGGLRDPGHDAMLPEPTRVGFTFSSADERRLEGDYARHIAGLIRSEFIVVIGRFQWKGKPAMVGVVYQVSTMRTLRVGVVPIVSEPDSERLLAHFLFVSEQPVPGLVSLPAPPWELPEPDLEVEPPSDGRYVLGWVSGLGTVAVGTALIALSDHEHEGLLVGGFALGSLGIALVATTTFYYLRRPKSSTPAVAIVPTTSGMFVSASLAF
jgi:hypothetical protein